MQKSYHPAWEFKKELKSGTITIDEGRQKCKNLATQKAKELRAQGYQVHRFTLANQLRQYWGLNEPCGISAPAYYVDYQ